MRLLGLVILSSLTLSTVESKELNLQNLRGFGGSVLMTLSDGDVYAQSYLGKGLPSHKNVLFRDVLSVIPLRGSVGEEVAIEVSNSVLGTPEVMAVAKNASWAVVVETAGGRNEESKTMKDLPQGERVFLIDLSGTGRILQERKLSFRPQSIDISHDERWIVIGGDSKERGMFEIIEVENLRLGQSTLHSFSTELSMVSSVRWHPKQPILAVHRYRQNKVSFWKFDPHGGDLKLSQWKNELDPGMDPFVGRFTPSGRYYITANWGRNFNAASIFDRLPKGESELSLIELARDSNPHRILKRLPVPASPEGLAVSPDGNLVVTISMQNSLYSVVRESESEASALALYRMNEHKGDIAEIARTEFPGILPEGGTFDLSGRYILASVFQNSKWESTYGKLEVFKIDFSENSLVNLGWIKVPHGTHQVVIK